MYRGEPRVPLKEWMALHTELASKPDHGPGPEKQEKTGNVNLYRCSCGAEYDFTDQQEQAEPHIYRLDYDPTAQRPTPEELEANENEGTTEDGKPKHGRRSKSPLPH